MSKAEILKAKAELAAHADAIRALGKRAVDDIIEIGRRLIDAKALVGHGHWLTWLEHEFGWNDDTALNYMRVAEAAAKSLNFRDLNVPVSALYLLAKPDRPREAVEQIAARSKGGERLRLVSVRSSIADAKAVVAVGYVRQATSIPEVTHARVVTRPTSIPAPPVIVSHVDYVTPDPVDPPRALTADEAGRAIRVEHMRKAREIIDTLAAFGEAATSDKLETITAAHAQACREFDAPAIRQVVEAILAGLDHPEKYAAIIASFNPAEAALGPRPAPRKPV